MPTNRTAALALAALAFLGCRVLAEAPSPEPPPGVDCRLSAGMGRLTATGGPRGTRIDVAGATFEGGATLKFKDTPPARLTFHFANLRGMHAFTFSDGKRTYVGTSPPLTARNSKTAIHWDRNGHVVNQPAQAGLSMVFEAKKTGGVEVSILYSGVEVGKDVNVTWTPYVTKLGHADS